MSITSRLAGICSAISLADSSTSTMAEDSSGSRKPRGQPDRDAIVLPESLAIAAADRESCAGVSPLACGPI